MFGISQVFDYSVRISIVEQCLKKIFSDRQIVTARDIDLILMLEGVDKSGKQSVFSRLKICLIRVLKIIPVK